MNPATPRIGALRTPRGLREARKRNAAEHREAMARLEATLFERRRRINQAIAEALKVPPSPPPRDTFWSRLWR